ncbi:MAG: ABC transporter ATP-binding protein [Eggerthellaceae bacterium]|jgi:ABC-2 type transport system ATP-binding protein|nr:ABC transporter ATP-binding protein [Eggerthellaceae bacterium]MDR2721788.1 ABC transporter ATP-binding protein [Coriobacteriaceae bacterium]
MTRVVLQTHALSKKYGSHFALNKVSLTLNQGDIYGLVGRNGAGKTTLFKCIMGLAKPSGGKIIINGEEENLNAVRSQMGFMINPSFFPYLNPKENLEYLCRIKGLTAKNEVSRLLKLVELEGVKKPYKAFSLGMKQRLGIAAALLGSPSLVVLDEPINGLDPQGIIDMRAVIKNVHEQTGATLIISSHILSELDLVATQFGFIEQGVLLQEISHKDLHEQTKNSLHIEVDDVEKTQAALRVLGVRNPLVEGNRIILQSHLDQSHKLARVFVSSGVEVYDLHRKETTLEEYFMRLVGGVQNA